LSRVVEREAYQERCTDAIVKDRDYEIISAEAFNYLLIEYSSCNFTD